MTLEQPGLAGLIAAISQTHALLAARADLGEYGGRLLERLVQRLDAAGVWRIEPRDLRRFRQFYAAYLQIREAVTPVLVSLPANGGVGQRSPSPRVLLERLSFTHFAELGAAIRRKLGGLGYEF